MGRKPAAKAATSAHTADGIGLVKVDGSGFTYVGLAPARDPKAQTPEGLPITNGNASWTPISLVPFDSGIKVKDPATGVYYYPADGVTSWEDVELNGVALLPE